MSDLRKAAEMALSVVLDPKTTVNEVADAVKTIRQVLAQSEWVGLSRDEVDYCFEQCVVRKFSQDGVEDSYVSIYKAAEAIEAALKEKNT